MNVGLCEWCFLFQIEYWAVIRNFKLHQTHFAVLKNRDVKFAFFLFIQILAITVWIKEKSKFNVPIFENSKNCLLWFEI